MFIYTITPVRHKSNEPEDMISCSCFGYYPDYTLAIQAIKDNKFDLHESYYNYLVVEQIGPGIHTNVTFETWFEFDIMHNIWVNCMKPEGLKKCKGFGIG